MPQLQPAQDLTRPRWRELGAVARIQRDSFRRDLAYKHWMLAFFWLTPGVKFLVSKEGDTVTGCIISDMYRGRIRIMNIAVHPDYRHTGIGYRLMKGVLDAQPEKSAVLMVQDHNAAAQSLYTRLGFERTGYHPNYYGTGNPGIEMVLKRS